MRRSAWVGLARRHVELPRGIVSFKFLSDFQQEDKKSDGKSKSGDSKREQKKPRLEHKKEDEVASDKVDEDFKLAKGELWGIVFKRKAREIDVPWNDSCKMCPRWHIFGHCWSTCDNAASHVPVDQVPPEKKELFAAWMAECRKKKKSN